MTKISDILIDEFLANFHYLNANGKRNTSRVRAFFACFDDPVLTGEIEKTANNLKDTLSGLKANSDLTDEAKLNDVHSAIETAITRVFELREDFGYKHQTKSGPGLRDDKPGRIGDAGYEIQTTHIDPKSPGKMEQELNTALQKARLKLVMEETGDANLKQTAISKIDAALNKLKNEQPQYTEIRMGLAD